MSEETPSPGKPVGASRITLSRLMGLEHANLRGDVHGGWIMRMADEAGALAAIRHSQCRVVTVAIDQMHFHEPIRLGDLVTFEAKLTYVGRTSMETQVRVIAENPMTGERTHTNTAFLVYVAIDENRKPQPVPGLITETEAEKRSYQAGKERQAHRLLQRTLISQEDKP